MVDIMEECYSFMDEFPDCMETFNLKQEKNMVKEIVICFETVQKGVKTTTKITAEVPATTTAKEYHDELIQTFKPEAVENRQLPAQPQPMQQGEAKVCAKCGAPMRLNAKATYWNCSKRVYGDDTSCQGFEKA
jgi:hypothetical protein